MKDCSLAEPYALMVLGDSMEPEFPDHCVVVIDPVDQCGDGAYVFVEVEGVRWFRQWRVDPRGQPWLLATNPLYPEIPLEGLNYKILGVIVQRNMDRKVKHYPIWPGHQAQAASRH